MIKWKEIIGQRGLFTVCGHYTGHSYSDVISVLMVTFDTPFVVHVMQKTLYGRYSSSTLILFIFTLLLLKNDDVVSVYKCIWVFVDEFLK
jgi:hypothetical protein